MVDVALKQFDGFVSAANLSSEPTGPYTISFGAAMNSMTRFGERTGLVLVTDVEVKEQVTGFFSEEFRIGDEGLVLRFSATQSFSDPGDALKTLEITNFATIFNIEAEFPIFRSRAFNWFVYGGFNYANVQTDIDDQAIVDDRLRVGYAGFRVLWRPPIGDGVVTAQIEGRQGLSVFGASTSTTSIDRSRSDATGIHPCSGRTERSSARRTMVLLLWPVPGADVC